MWQAGGVLAAGEALVGPLAAAAAAGGAAAEPLEELEAVLAELASVTQVNDMSYKYLLLSDHYINLA